MGWKLQNTGSSDQVILDDDGETVLKTVAPDGFVFLQCGEDAPPEDPPSGGFLAPAVAAWNTAHAGDKVLWGGAETFGTPVSFSGNKTFLTMEKGHALRQHGGVTRLVFDVVANNTAGWKVKVFRKSGADYNLVGETAAFQPSGTGTKTIDFSPITGCEPGDMPAIFVPSVCNLGLSYAPTYSYKYGTGDLSTFPSVTPDTDYYHNIRAYGPSPFLAFIGDSILAGHGEDFYRPYLDGGIEGNPAGEPASHIRAACSGLSYQNFSVGGTGWAFAAANVGKVAAVTSRGVVCNPGVNDLARSWSAISADMATFKAGLPSGCKMFVIETLPYTAGSDSEAVAIRDLNGQYATWCAANGAVLIACHDAMGQNRSSTSHLDDLKTAYDFDGIHLTTEGVEAFAAIIFAALDNYSW